MPRLFTALEVPDDVTASLSLLRGGLTGARWVDPDNYHVTLRFIGDIDDALARDITLALAEVRRPATTLRLDGLAVFGGRKPRAIIASVAPTAALLELQAEHERLLRRVGVEPETRKFTPHVTLARLNGTSSRQAADYLAMHGLFDRLAFAADRFVLYSARASVGGGPYVVEAAYPLDGPGPA